MLSSMQIPTLLNRLYSEIRRDSVAFVIAFFVIVLITYGILYAIDFIPEPVAQGQSDEIAAENDDEMVEDIEEKEEVVLSPLPLKIIFDSLDKEVDVLNPRSREVADLDAALLQGVVRHPDSADLTQEGNVFILGHSSYLPQVFNKNFQAFNGIQELAWGDTIRLQSSDAEYTYRVQKVYKAKASEVVVPSTPGQAKLTLATCNSFASKDDRFIVEAELIDTKTL